MCSSLSIIAKRPHCIRPETRHNLFDRIRCGKFGIRKWEFGTTKAERQTICLQTFSLVPQLMEHERADTMTQGIEGARRLMETTDPETVNQYLRFGWKLINQHVVEATLDTPARVKYVLASVRRIEETKELLTLDDTAAVNEHLNLGWTLIDKYVTAVATETRHEAIHFIVAWQGEGVPVKPGSPEARAVAALEEQLAGDIELEST
jgi:hypothetical protein